MTIERKEYQLDVVVAGGGDGIAPVDRPILCIGEAKSGETVGLSHLYQLERARASLGPNAAGARLLLFAPAFAPDLQRATASRGDTELIDFERLYNGS